MWTKQRLVYFLYEIICISYHKKWKHELVQFFPSPAYPGLHLQIKLPTVLLHMAFGWHTLEEEHSSMSEKKHALIIISALYIYLPIGKMTQKKIVITIWTTWTWMAIPCIPLITRTSVASDCIHTCSISVASVFSQCAFINVFILWKEKKVIKIYVCMYYLYKIWSRTKNLQC